MCLGGAVYFSLCAVAAKTQVRRAAAAAARLKVFVCQCLFHGKLHCSTVLCVRLYLYGVRENIVCSHVVYIHTYETRYAAILRYLCMESFLYASTLQQTKV